MATFICMMTYTHQGLKQLSATTNRSEAFMKKAEQLGAKVIATYWTLGIYDIVHIIEAEDEKMAASLALSSGALGNVRSHTMPAFTLEEMKSEIIPNVQSQIDLIPDDA